MLLHIHSVTEALVLIFPTFYAMTGGLILQWLIGYNFSLEIPEGTRIKGNGLERRGMA